MGNLICFFAGLVTALVACPSASADDTKFPAIGAVFGANTSAARPYEEAFRVGMRDLGYVDGKNVKIVTRYANGDAGQVPKLVTELIAVSVQVLVASNKAVREAGK